MNEVASLRDSFNLSSMQTMTGPYAAVLFPYVFLHLLGCEPAGMGTAIPSGEVFEEHISRDGAVLPQAF